MKYLKVTIKHETASYRVEDARDTGISIHEAFSLISDEPVDYTTVTETVGSRVILDAMDISNEDWTEFVNENNRLRESMISFAGKYMADINIMPHITPKFKLVDSKLKHSVHTTDVILPEGVYYVAYYNGISRRHYSMSKSHVVSVSWEYKRVKAGTLWTIIDGQCFDAPIPLDESIVNFLNGILE